MRRSFKMASEAHIFQNQRKNGHCSQAKASKCLVNAQSSLITTRSLQRKRGDQRRQDLMAHFQNGQFPNPTCWSLQGTSVDTKRFQDVPKLVVFAITIPPRMYFFSWIQDKVYHVFSSLNQEPYYRKWSSMGFRNQKIGARSNVLMSPATTHAAAARVIITGVTIELKMRARACCERTIYSWRHKRHLRASAPASKFIPVIFDWACRSLGSPRSAPPILIRLCTTLSSPFP